MGNTITLLGLPGGVTRVVQFLEADKEEEAIRDIRDYNPVKLRYCQPDGQTFLHHAALGGHVAFIKELRKGIWALAEGSAVNKKEWSYLKKARKNKPGSSEAQGAKGTANVWEKLVNARNNKGQTPLMLACSKGNHKVVELLLQLGADPIMRDSMNDRTPLHYAASGSGSLSCVEALLSDKVTCMTDQGLRRLRDCWIDQGIEGSQHRYIDCPDKQNITPLHLAAAAGNVRVCKALLRAGCRIDVFADKLWVLQHSSSSRSQRRSGTTRVYPCCTALHVSAARGDFRIARAMLRNYVMSSRALSGKDVRLMRDGAGLQPYQVEMMRADSRLEALLDPTVPLALALASDTAVHREKPWGPMSLKVLSAATLQMTLLQQLDGLEPPQSERIALVTDRSTRCSTSGSWGPSVRGFLRSPKRTSKDASNNSDNQEGSDGEEDPCCCPCPSPMRFCHHDGRDGGPCGGDADKCSWAEAECGGEEPEGSTCRICYESPPSVNISVCGHRLCVPCGRQLCVSTGFGRAPRCPFCRLEIAEFL
eukprot:jgi/Botrbrau1/12926/Bobra.92_1s0006.1